MQIHTQPHTPALHIHTSTQSHHHMQIHTHGCLLSPHRIDMQACIECHCHHSPVQNNNNTHTHHTHTHTHHTHTETDRHGLTCHVQLSERSCIYIFILKY